MPTNLYSIGNFLVVLCDAAVVINISINDIKVQKITCLCLIRTVHTLILLNYIDSGSYFGFVSNPKYFI